MASNDNDNDNDNDTALSLGDTQSSSIGSSKENYSPKYKAVKRNDMKLQDTSEKSILAMPERLKDEDLSVRPYLQPISESFIRSLCREVMKNPDSDQRLLERSGIVSFVDVIFPSVVQQHQDALARLNAIVKRDYPDFAQNIKNVRKRFVAAMQTSVVIIDQQPSFAKGLLQARQQPQELDPKELVQLRRNSNKALWEEIANLMEAKLDLAKEQQKWHAVRCNLEEKLNHLKAKLASEEEIMANEEPMETDNIVTTAIANSKEDQIMEKIHDAVTWMRTSAMRLTEGLPDVTQLVESTEQQRIILYESYKKATTLHEVPTMDLLSQAFSQENEDDINGDDQSVESL